MPLPDTKDIYRPLLEVLRDEAPHNLSINDLMNIAAEHFDLGELSSIDRNLFKQRVNHAKNELKKNKLLTNPSNNIYIITAAGLNYLNNQDEQTEIIPEESEPEAAHQNIGDIHEAIETEPSEITEIHETETGAKPEDIPQDIEELPEIIETEPSEIIETYEPEFESEPQNIEEIPEATETEAGPEDIEEISETAEITEIYEPEPETELESEPDDYEEIQTDSEEAEPESPEETESEAAEEIQPPEEDIIIEDEPEPEEPESLPEIEQEIEPETEEAEAIPEETYEQPEPESEPEPEIQSEEETYEDDDMSDDINMMNPSTGIEDAVRIHNEELAEKVLSGMSELPPEMFEVFVIDLLSKMGYRAFQNARYTSDEAGNDLIHGVIIDDKTGTPIYIQARESSPDRTIGKADMQDFIDALSDKGGKGIFATTAKFSEQAEILANDERIMLIDGMKLAGLMIAHNFCVKVEKVYEIKEFDTESFSEYQR